MVAGPEIASAKPATAAVNAAFVPTVAAAESSGTAAVSAGTVARVAVAAEPIIDAAPSVATAAENSTEAISGCVAAEQLANQNWANHCKAITTKLTQELMQRLASFVTEFYKTQKPDPGAEMPEVNFGDFCQYLSRSNIVSGEPITPTVPVIAAGLGSVSDVRNNDLIVATLRRMEEKIEQIRKDLHTDDLLRQDNVILEENRCVSEVTGCLKNVNDTNKSAQNIDGVTITTQQLTHNIETTPCTRGKQITTESPDVEHPPIDTFDEPRGSVGPVDTLETDIASGSSGSIDSVHSTLSETSGCENNLCVYNSIESKLQQIHNDANQLDQTAGCPIYSREQVDIWMQQNATAQEIQVKSEDVSQMSTWSQDVQILEQPSSEVIQLDDSVNTTQELIANLMTPGIGIEVVSFDLELDNIPAPATDPESIIDMLPISSVSSSNSVKGTSDIAAAKPLRSSLTTLPAISNATDVAECRVLNLQGTNQQPAPKEKPICDRYVTKRGARRIGPKSVVEAVTPRTDIADVGLSTSSVDNDLNFSDESQPITLAKRKRNNELLSQPVSKSY